jgi:hypothetical protein
MLPFRRCPPCADRLALTLTHEHLFVLSQEFQSISPARRIQGGVHAVEAGQNDRTGLFFNGTHRGRAHRQAYRGDVQQRLASLTANLLSRVEGADEAAW